MHAIMFGIILVVVILTIIILVTFVRNERTSLLGKVSYVLCNNVSIRATVPKTIHRSPSNIIRRPFLQTSRRRYLLHVSDFNILIAKKNDLQIPLFESELLIFLFEVHIGRNDSFLDR